jgi:membrane-bound lytic murein transglycosylase F
LTTPRENSTLTLQRRIAMGLVALGLALAVLLPQGEREARDARAHLGPLGNVLSARTLVVLTHAAPTTLHNGQEGITGFEVELSRAFADYLGVDVRYRVYDTTADVLAALARGEGHIAAAGLTRTASRENRYRFGPAYKSVSQQLVCNRHGPRPGGIADLGGLRLEVVDGSAHEETLTALAAAHEDIVWRRVNNLGTDGLLERVAAGEADCAIADSNTVAITRRYHPELDVVMEINGPQDIAWAVAPDARWLDRALARWFEREETVALLDALDERFYGHVSDFDYVDVLRFRQRVERRLPRYRRLFEDAAAETGLPWTLIAAVAYQESHWDPEAVSPTGVRGLMMLTLRTAEHVGVADRVDPEESIHGGARYLAELYRRMPDSVAAPDRLWFALAAYNVGIGHLMDARLLARRKGLDPDSWRDLQTVLPLLARSEYHRTLRFGYARGWEPVIYVRQVRHYLDILERLFPADNGGGDEDQRDAVLPGGAGGGATLMVEYVTATP